MRRANGSLMLGVVLSFLVLCPLRSPVRGQVDVDWVSRHETSSSTAEIVATLEKSQAALLQARQAVDSALSDIDLALASLRETTPDEIVQEGFFSRAASKLDSFSRGFGEALAGGLERMKQTADDILEGIAVQLEEPESGESVAEPPAVPATASEPMEALPAPAVAQDNPEQQNPLPESATRESSSDIEAPELFKFGEEEPGQEEPAEKAPLQSLEEKSEGTPPKEPGTVEGDYGESTSHHRPCGEFVPDF